MNFWKTIIFVLLASSAFAQDSINTRLLSTSDSLETMSVEDAMGPRSGLSQERYLARISYDLTTRPLIAIDLTRSTQRFSVINQMHGFNAGFGARLTERIFVSVDLPVHYVRLDQSYRSTYGLTMDPNGWKLGDVELRSKIRLTSDSSKTNIAIMPFIALPTGNDEFFVSDDSYLFGGKIIMDASPLPFFHLYANAGYAYAHNAYFLNVDRTKRVELAAGGVLELSKTFALNAETNGAITFPGFDQDQNPVSMRLGWRMITGDLRWFCGISWDGFRDVTNNRGNVYAALKVPFGVLHE
jgi:hypothetical protein